MRLSGAIEASDPTSTMNDTRDVLLGTGMRRAEVRWGRHSSARWGHVGEGASIDVVVEHSRAESTCRWAARRATAKGNGEASKSTSGKPLKVIVTCDHEAAHDT